MIDGMWVLPATVHLPLYYLIMAFGLIAGDWEERTVAGGNIGLAVTWLLTGAAVTGSNPPMELGGDCCLCGVFAVVALRSNKAWPMANASLTLLALLTDVAQTLAHAHTWAFGTAQLAWELLSDLLLAWGTWQALRRRRRIDRATAGAPAMT